MMEFHVYHVLINSIFMNFDACRDLIKIGITLQTSTYIYRKTAINKQILKLLICWDLNQMIMQTYQIVIKHILIMMVLLVLIVLCLLCSLIKQVEDVLFVMLIRSIMRVKELVRIDRFCIFLIEMIIFQPLLREVLISIMIMLPELLLLTMSLSSRTALQVKTQITNHVSIVLNISMFIL